MELILGQHFLTCFWWHILTWSHWNQQQLMCQRFLDSKFTEVQGKEWQDNFQACLGRDCGYFWDYNYIEVWKRFLIRRLIKQTHYGEARISAITSRSFTWNNRALRGRMNCFLLLQNDSVQLFSSRLKSRKGTSLFSHISIVRLCPVFLYWFENNSRLSCFKEFLFFASHFFYFYSNRNPLIKVFVISCTLLQY